MTLLSEPDSMLAKMFSGELPPGAKDEQGAYMVDGTPEYFKPILNCLRRRELLIDPNISKDGVLAEARFFGIQGLVNQMEKIAEDASRIALEEKEMKLRKLAEEKEMKLQKLAEEKSQQDLLLLKERLICLDLLRKHMESKKGMCWDSGYYKSLFDNLEKRVRNMKL